LTSVRRRRRAAVKAASSKNSSSGVDRDVREAGGQPTGGVVLATRGLDRQAAERALVDEPQLATAVGEAEPRPQVRLVGLRRLLHQQLAAHAEVGDEGLAGRGAVGLGQRQPQVLPPAAGGGQRAAGDRGGEVLDALEVPPDGSRVVHLDRGDGAAGHPALQSAPDHLDLGQLRHGGRSVRGAEVRQAASAASCSAAFLVRPVPRPLDGVREEDRRGERLRVVGPSSSVE
jgi:hypothetical protein